MNRADKIHRRLFATICVAVAAQGATAQMSAGHPGGIWKAAVPDYPMQGEFDSLDPLGIAAGAKIKADCSLNWVDPDDGRLYCFASGTSLVYFMDQPQANLERARKAWVKMAGTDK
jgi:hypothetical protein